MLCRANPTFLSTGKGVILDEQCCGRHPLSEAQRFAEGPTEHRALAPWHQHQAGPEIASVFSVAGSHLIQLPSIFFCHRDMTGSLKEKCRRRTEGSACVVAMGRWKVLGTWPLRRDYQVLPQDFSLLLSPQEAPSTQSCVSS